jgi:hypothetical protein
MFEGCAECLDQSGVAWDGTFFFSPFVTSLFCEVQCGWTTGSGLPIDGKKMTAAKIYICSNGQISFDVYCEEIIDEVGYEVLIWEGIGECFEGNPDVVFTQEVWAGCSPGPGAITVHFEASP